MLKLCGAEGSSFRWLMGAVSCFCWDPSNFVFEVDLGAEQHFVCMSVHQIDPLWCCCQTLIDAFNGWDPSDFCFWGGSCSEVAYWILSTVCCWSSIGSTVRGSIFGCCQLFCCWVSVLVFSSDSLIVGFRPSFREWMPFVEIHQILFLRWISLQCWVFWDETCQMVSLQWLEPSECFWLESMVGVADCLFLIAVSPLLLRQRSVSGVPPLALISQLVCHNCSVPGFTDGAGFRFGWMLQYVTWSNTFCLWRCRKNRKPRLDFSSRCLTSFEAGPWTHRYCEHVG
jgi:hypothetical protein